MKHILTGLLFFLLLTNANAQAAGHLMADTSQAHNDTFYFKKLVYLDGTKIAVDTTAYVIQKIAPMVFVGDKNVKAKTDQQSVLKEEIFIQKGKLKIDGDDVIKYILKEKKLAAVGG
jgi:hypothetical protein